MLSVSALPSSLVSLLSACPAVGFSGSRSLLPCSVAALRSVAGVVPASASVFVGCAAGADAVARGLFPGAVVFSVASGAWGRGRGAFAGRSVACVRAVVGAGGAWVSFPCSPCPAGLLPSSSSSRCFRGLGSGSWASLAFAVGSGVLSVVFLPPSVPCPVGWGFASLGGGWWVARPACAQLSLFS